MSITDELRKYANRFKNSHDAWSGIGDDLTAIADRIDAEHQKALDEWKVKHGQMWLKGYSECHAELLEGNETLAADLENCGWVRLPVDAGGEYIHAGDVMEERSGHTFEVASLMAFGGSDNWLVLSNARNFSSLREPNDIRHHHAPTVEDVLREVLFKAHIYDKREMELLPDLIAEYAAKLQLKEDV